MTLSSRHHRYRGSPFCIPETFWPAHCPVFACGPLHWLQTQEQRTGYRPELSSFFSYDVVQKNLPEDSSEQNASRYHCEKANDFFFIHYVPFAPNWWCGLLRCFATLAILKQTTINQELCFRPACRVLSASFRRYSLSSFLLSFMQLLLPRRECFCKMEDLPASTHTGGCSW